MKAWVKPEIWELDAKNTACAPKPIPSTPTPKPNSGKCNPVVIIIKPPSTGGGFKLC